LGPITRNLLLMQGYKESTVCECKSINMLARWTPLACAVLGTIGLFSHSVIYMAALGILTTIGAFSSHSFYDYLYSIFFNPILKFGDIPAHGNQRRFGCAIGAGLYLLSACGMATGNAWLTYVPAVIIISLAYVAAFTQWCFASTLYNAIFRK
jgi:hypothetical protein